MDGETLGLNEPRVKVHVMVDNVLWPAYFDASLTRREGRRVSKDSAIEDPTVDEIAEAVSQVGYDVVIERDVSYSREPHCARGRVIVKDADDAGKGDLIQATAAFLNAARA